MMETLPVDVTNGMLDTSESSSSSFGSCDVKSVKKQRFRRRTVWRCLYCLSVVWLLVWLGYLHYLVFQQNKLYLDLEKKLQEISEWNNWDPDSDEAAFIGRYNRDTHDVAPIGDTEDEIEPKRKNKKKPKEKRPSGKDEKKFPGTQYTPVGMLQSAQQTLESATSTLNDATKTLKTAMRAKGRYHPSIQLSLLEKGNNTILSDNLVWTDGTVSSHSTTTEGKYTGIDQFFHFDTRDQAIQIRRTGRYVVYAQLTYSGRLHTNLNFPITNPDCSYSVELVDQNRNQPNIPKYGLLYASVTQHSLGRVIHRTVDGRALTAHDTAYTSGVFILRENEKISLKTGWGTPCDVKTSEDKAFFGIYLLSENY